MDYTGIRSRHLPVASFLGWWCPLCRNGKGVGVLHLLGGIVLLAVPQATVSSRHIV